MTGWFALVLIVAVVVATAAIFAAGRKAGTAAAALPFLGAAALVLLALVPIAIGRWHIDL